MNTFLLVFLFSFSLYASEETLDQIEVTHHEEDQHLAPMASGPSKVIHEKELRKRREFSLGDTLRNEAGVSSNSFGPNAGRPIIRGLEGDRVRILQNGLGVLDASSQSVDHAVPVDTLIIDSIEIVRGPMSLLYGPQAMGGVVNLTTNRIHSQFEEGAVKEVKIQGESVNAGGTIASKIDYGKNNWMFHIDGSLRNANDQKIPGYVRSKKERSSSPLPPGESEKKNELPNSQSSQKTAALGISRIFNKGHVGVSYYYFDNSYGTVAEEDVTIKMKQNRFELHGDYRLDDSVVKLLRFKSAQADYSHREFEGSDLGTTFLNQGNESRLEVHTLMGEVKGTHGAQTQLFNFKATGAEAYLPPTKNALVSFFTLNEIKRENSLYFAGLRFDSTHVENEESGGSQRNFKGMSASLGYSRELTKEYSSTLNFGYTERAPNFQELFANGIHIAANTFELGNEDLSLERAYSADLGFKYQQGLDSAQINFFTQQFKDYISLFDTGVLDPSGEFNVFRHQQVDAVFYGAEFEGRKQISKSSWSLLSKADFVRAKNKDTGENLPRITPPRLSLGLEYVKAGWTWDAEAQYNFEQTKVADNETRSESFTLLNAGVSKDINGEKTNANIFLRFKNILNQEARAHTSTLKDIAPMPGRNVVAGVQYLF